MKIVLFNSLLSVKIKKKWNKKAGTKAAAMVPGLLNNTASSAVCAEKTRKSEKAHKAKVNVRIV